MENSSFAYVPLTTLHLPYQKCSISRSPDLSSISGITGLTDLFCNKKENDSLERVSYSY